MDQTKKDKLGYISGIVSVGINVLLFGLKYWAGIVSGSVALLADAWHTLSDSISSVIVIVGVKLSSQKADHDHPFGHGRWEQIASIFIGFFLAIIAFDFLKESILRLKAHEEADYGTLAIVITSISVLFKEGLAQFSFYVHKRSENSSVKADGWHHRTDALSSLVILLGIFLEKYFWWIDGVLGLIISLMLFYAVFDILKEAINKVLGERVPVELIKKIEDIVKDEIPFKVYPHHFHIHNYGRHKELTFHIKLNKNETLDNAHEIADRIERKIKDNIHIEATIHVEPFDE